MLHEVYDKDKKLPANMKKASKLTYKAMHPGDNKQSVPLAIWWYLVDNKEFNSKQEFNANFWTGNAAVKDDKKTFVFTRICESAGGLAKSAEQKFSKIHLEQAGKYCSCHYSPMYCVPYWRSSYGKEMQICFNLSIPNRLSGVKILDVQVNEWWKIFIWFARNAGIWKDFVNYELFESFT